MRARAEICETIRFDGEHDSTARRAFPSGKSGFLAVAPSRLLKRSPGCAHRASLRATAVRTNFGRAAHAVCADRRGDVRDPALLPALAIPQLRVGRAIGWQMIAGYAVGISLVTYLVYRHDKRQALAAGWRINESTLHLLEMLGGWPGAFVAQRLLRHKNRQAALSNQLLGDRGRAPVHRPGYTPSVELVARRMALVARQFLTDKRRPLPMRIPPSGPLNSTQRAS